MDKPLLSYSVWLSYPPETRKKLVALFSIPRTGQSVVHVGAMIAGNIAGEAREDGYAPGDLYAITIERMQEVLKTDDTDFHNMLSHIVDNIDAIYADSTEPELPVIEVEAAPVDKETPVYAPKPRAEVVVEPVVETVPVPEETTTEPPAEEEFVPRDPEELIKPKEENDAPKPRAAKKAK